LFLDRGGKFWEKFKRSPKNNKYLDFTTEYKVVEIFEKKYSFTKKPIKCFRIRAMNSGLYGNSALKFDFSSDYGFVRLEYQNIDSSYLVLNLEKIKEANDFNIK